MAAKKAATAVKPAAETMKPVRKVKSKVNLDAIKLETGKVITIPTKPKRVRKAPVKPMADVTFVPASDFILDADTEPKSAIDRCIDMNVEEAGTISEKIYLLDENCADGSAMFVVGTEAAIALIDELLPDEDVRFARAEAKAEADAGNKALLDWEQIHEDQTAQITDLTGQLRDEEAAHSRSVATMRVALNEVDLRVEDLLKKFNESDQKVLRLERLADPTAFFEPVVIVGPTTAKGEIEIRVTEDLPRYRTEGCSVFRLKRGTDDQAYPSLSSHNRQHFGELLLGDEYTHLKRKGWSYDAVRRDLAEAQTEVRQLKAQLHAEEANNKTLFDYSTALKNRGFWARVLNRLK